MNIQFKELEDSYVEEARAYAEEAIRTCTKCTLCFDACTLYRATRDPSLSPVARLQAATRVLRGEKISDSEIVSLYTCNLCGACTYACPYAIEVLRVVHAARIVLGHRGIIPSELANVREAAARSGHSFVLDASKAARVLVEVANETGVSRDSGDVLYVPSPFDTTLYTSLLRDTLLLLKRVAGDAIVVSERALDFGGNVGIDANALSLAMRMVENVIKVADSAGARTIVLGACGADTKLRILLEKLGVKLSKRVLSLYEFLNEKGYRLECKDCLLYASCTFARLEEKKSLLKVTNARTSKDKPPFTMCCGGAGGLNFLHSKPYGDIRKMVYKWRFERLARDARGSPIIIPCVKCYSVFKHGALLSKKPRYPLILYPTLTVKRGSASQP